MKTASHQAHWENVHTRKGENEVCWFQENPTPSLELVDQMGPSVNAAIIDVGGGASGLVDGLMEDFRTSPFFKYRMPLS